MVTRAKCLMGIIFLLSLATPCWSQTSYPQGPATSYSDRIVYPPYTLFGMPVTNPTPNTLFGMPLTNPPSNQQMSPIRTILPPGVSPGQGGSQPVSEPASNPATDPATNPVPH